MNLLAMVDDLDGLIRWRFVDLGDNVDVATRESSSVHNVGELEELVFGDLEDGSELLVEKSWDRG